MTNSFLSKVNISMSLYCMSHNIKKHYKIN